MSGAPPPRDDILERVLRLYDGERRATRFHVAMRARRVPFPALEALLPREGRVADLGCGHGVFANLLALAGPRREVVGIDRDAGKIEIAARTVGSRGNIRFSAGDLSTLRLDPFDAIAIIGVLYLIPYPRHRPILEQCRDALAPGGTLLLNTVDPSEGIRFWRSKIIEFTANMAFRLTGAQSTSVPMRLYPRRREEWKAMLASTGFSASAAAVPLATPGNVFICRRGRAVLS
ncbi:MAG: class I SAM-dependent methyltransferase [bacterium]|nr:class I SAM-dependent methyltransferase [bacterium]